MKIKNIFLLSGALWILNSIVLIGQSSEAAESNEARINFDENKPGSLPEGWKIDATHPGKQLAQWEVTQDNTAPSQPNLLSLTQTNNSSDDVFNLYWTRQILFKNGSLEVKMKANSGDADQGGGLIWRVQDADNYYIARYNPLERNFRVYFVKDSYRKMLASINADIPSHEWFVMTVIHQRNEITCLLNGQELLHVKDETFPNEGGVGFWTKADAASSFDDFVVRKTD